MLLFFGGGDCSQVANRSTILVANGRILVDGLASSSIHWRETMVLVHYILGFVRLLTCLGTSGDNSLSINIAKFTQLIEKIQRSFLEESGPVVALETPSN